MVLGACYVPEPATPPPRTPVRSGGDAGAAACSCYFEAWSLWTPCGHRCLGDAKLSCSAGSATVDPTGCAFPGADGGGAPTDAGLIVEDELDAGVDAGTACPVAPSTCGCTIHPYQTDGFSLTIPCCTTLCVASVTDRAWSCTETGQTIVSSAAICRR